VLPGQTWRVGTTVLAPGETLVAVSDGLLDLFPDTRTALAELIALDRECRDAQGLVDRIAALCRRDAVMDDVTTVVVRRHDAARGR
jgi:serine phosphatase RsbU (regulator of sigma subunit)